MDPLNQTAICIFEILVGDETTGQWLFSKNGQPVKSIKKGFSSACEQAGIENLRSYDLRHTFATRLVERNVQIIIISELLGHSQPLQSFGHASRITPGYAHATYDAMRRAVDSPEHRTNRDRLRSEVEQMAVKWKAKTKLRRPAKCLDYFKKRNRRVRI